MYGDLSNQVKGSVQSTGESYNEKQTEAFTLFVHEQIRRRFFNYLLIT